MLFSKLFTAIVMAGVALMSLTWLPTSNADALLGYCSKEQGDHQCSQATVKVSGPEHSNKIIPFSDCYVWKANADVVKFCTDTACSKCVTQNEPYGSSSWLSGDAAIRCVILA